MSLNEEARKYFIQASQGLNGQYQQAQQGLANTGLPPQTGLSGTAINQIYQNSIAGTPVASIEDTAPSEYWTPVEEVFPKEETEEEKQVRLWRAILEFAR